MGGSDATLHAGKEALVSEGSPFGGPQLGLEAAEGDGWALSDVQGAHNGEAGVLAVAAAVVVGAGAGVAGGGRGRAHQRVGEHQWEAGQALALPRCASEGAERLGLAGEGRPGTASPVLFGNQDEVLRAPFIRVHGRFRRGLWSTVRSTGMRQTPEDERA